MLTHRIIEAPINDNSDYDWMYDSALHNTLRTHFEWAKKSKIDIAFEIALTMKQNIDWVEKSTDEELIELNNLPPATFSVVKSNSDQIDKGVIFCFKDNFYNY